MAFDFVHGQDVTHSGNFLYLIHSVDFISRLQQHDVMPCTWHVLVHIDFVCEHRVAVSQTTQSQSMFSLEQ